MGQNLSARYYDMLMQLGDKTKEDIDFWYKPFGTYNDRNVNVFILFLIYNYPTCYQLTFIRMRILSHFISLLFNTCVCI